MKKHIILSSLLLSFMALTSCDGTYDDWASPQHNDAEDAVTIPGFTATATSAIDLGNVGDSVQVFTLSTATLPAGSTMEQTRVVITPQGTPTDETVATLTTSNGGKIDSTSLQNAIVANYGKRPLARTYSARVYSDIVQNGQAMLVDAGTINIVATPAAPFIASAYYLVGDMVGWNAASMQKLTHSSKDVYEDPVFSIEIKTTKDGQNLKFIPQTNVDASATVPDDFWHEGTDGVVGTGTDGDASTSGTLVTTKPGAIKIAEAGTYLVTINMMDYTYTIEKTNKYYLVGALQGWKSTTDDMTCLLYPEGNGISSYTTKWTGDHNMKIWDTDTFGSYNNAYGTAVDGDESESSSLINSNAKSFKSPTGDELYTLTVNMSNKTYTWKKLDDQNPTSYSKVSLIGVFNKWSDEPMTEVTPHNWYIKHTQTTTGELKFRANGGWDVNWGNNGDVLNISDKYYGTGTNNGANFNLPAGTYKIYLNDITGQFAFIAQ